MSRILFNELFINSGFVLNDLSEKVINEITNEITWIGRQNGITLSPEIKTERTEPERVTTELLISYNGSSPKPGKLNRHFPGAQHTAKWISHENQKMDRQTLSFNKENRAKLIFPAKNLTQAKKTGMQNVQRDPFTGLILKQIQKRIADLINNYVPAI